MRSILEELWYGNVAPFEQCNSYDDEMKELIALISQHRKELDKVFTEKQKEIFENLMDCSNELDGKFEKQAFLYGFRLGARLVIDAMTE